MSLLNKKMEVYFGSNRIVNQPKIEYNGWASPSNTVK